MERLNQQSRGSQPHDLVFPKKEVGNDRRSMKKRKKTPQHKKRQALPGKGQENGSGSAERGRVFSLKQQSVCDRAQPSKSIPTAASQALIFRWMSNSQSRQAALWSHEISVWSGSRPGNETRRSKPGRVFRRQAVVGSVLHAKGSAFVFPGQGRNGRANLCVIVTDEGVSIQSNSSPTPRRERGKKARNSTPSFHVSWHRGSQGLSPTGCRTSELGVE
ncbi:uncharacterized protein BJX67DRAFT_84531 [Aspergillus lucknowensis]|uniref:Uncharacterized protein n=1 Tax=Aspergillus lucknowensis TaxID=176173 RepID=A0ABR4LS20_9EURO